MKNIKKILFFLSIALIFSTCGKDDEVTKVEKFDLKFEIVTNFPTKSELDGRNPFYVKTKIVDTKSDANIKAKYDHIKEFKLEGIEIEVANTQKSSKVLKATDLQLILRGKNYGLRYNNDPFIVVDSKAKTTLKDEYIAEINKILNKKEVMTLEYTVQVTGRGSFDMKYIMKGRIKGGG